MSRLPAQSQRTDSGTLLVHGDPVRRRRERLPSTQRRERMRLELGRFGLCAIRHVYGGAREMCKKAADIDTLIDGYDGFQSSV